VDLVELVRRPEGKTLEFKRDLSSPDGALRTIVAFANTAGGTLLIGVEDATRHVRGVRAPLDLEERLASLISDSIVPRLVPDLEILPWRRTHVVAVQVHPSAGRPHYLKRAGLETGAYVRVGSTNRRADRELIEELRRFARGVAYDEEAMPDLNSEALDFRAASESFAPVRKLKRSDMDTLRLVAIHQGRRVPTVGGMLLFGKDRERHFPDAWIQAGRFRGTDKAHIVDRAEIRVHAPQAVEAAIDFVQKHTLHGAEIGAVRRRERWSLPPVAVREAIINAVAHADYAQRGISKLRNRVIGRVFHELGLIEQWGSGIQRMTAACRDAGLAAPVLEELGTRFRVTLHTERSGSPALESTDQAILDALAGRDGLSTRDIAAAIDLTSRATRTRLAKLVERGLVREIGTSPQDPKRRYFRAG